MKTMKRKLLIKGKIKNFQYGNRLAYMIVLLIIGFNRLQANNTKIEVPIDLSLNKPVIELFINNKGPYKFIFDTGASGNVIDSEVATTLELPEIGQTEVGSPGSDVKTLVPQVNIQNITISGKEFKDLSMIKMNLRNMIPVDGILSYQEFSEFLININFPGKKIILEKGEIKEKDADAVTLVSGSEILTVQLEVNGKKWITHLDTGSPFMFSFPYSAKDELNLQSPPVEIPSRSRTINMVHKNWKAVLDGNIKLGKIIYNSPEIILSERYNERVNVGYRLIKDLSITIDLKKQLIKFDKIEIAQAPEKNNKAADELGIVGRYGGVRGITYENGKYYIQRDGSMKLELVKTDEDLYIAELPRGVRTKNTLPKIRFESNSNGQIKGLTFIYQNGREEYVKKDN